MSIRSLIVLAALSLSPPWMPFAQAAPARRDAMIEVAPGVEIHAIEAGVANGDATLVLIPGWRFVASVWDEQIDAFARTRRVVAIDPRAQGRSTKTAEGDTPEQRARDLAKVLEHFALGRIVLVGWSQGVQDVAAFVDQFGTGRIERVVLVDSTVSGGAKAIAAQPQFAAQQLGLLPLYADDPAAYTRGMLHAVIRRPLGAARMAQLLDDALATPTAIGTAPLVADLFGADRTGALAKFDRPVLVIASAASAELAAQKTMAATLPHARIEVVENAGHAVFVDQPGRFDALLDAFMRENRP